MSQLITLDVQDGIVMAADSRTTYSGDGPYYSDHSNKLFVTKSNVGISTCGNATIKDERIQLFIEKFVDEHQELNALEVSQQILPYFKSLDEDLDTTFHVAGYVNGEQKVFRVYTKKGTITNCEHTYKGLIWNGDNYVINRLLNKMYSVKDDGTSGGIMEHRQIPWETFVIRDAIDFVKFIMDTAIAMQRFHKKEHTVGGDIDILVIKKDHAEWYAHK